MKVAPSMATTRMTARQINSSLSLPPHYINEGSNDIDRGKMAAHVVCLPLSTSVEKDLRPICRQLFRSLDNNIHYEHCNHGRNLNNQGKGVRPFLTTLLSPSPPRSPRSTPVKSSANMRESTPPPSPYSSKNNSSAMTFLKTSPSVRTAETESIASLSSYGTANTKSTTKTPPFDRSPPVSTTRTTRPRTPVTSFGFYPYQYNGHIFHEHATSVSFSSYSPKVSSVTNKSNNRLELLTAPRHSHTKKKKKCKNRVSDLLPAHAYDNRNHSRHSSCRTSNNNSPSLGLDNNNSAHSGHSCGGMKNFKTEYCSYYLKGEYCPYGNGCHYAHGEDELQTKGLLDLQNNGHIEDASTYRIKPCFSHVAMGSCPFGKRCACIHDPRVTGVVQSWLPITETQGNNIMTDINVEGLHQKRRFEILYGDPFVGGSRLSDLMNCSGGDRDAYHYDSNDLYNMVANINNQHVSGNRGWSRRGRGNTGIHKRRHRHNNQSVREVHKLSIALQMHGGTHRWMYKYRPSHTISNELCMILDERAFCLDESSGIATPLPISDYRSGNPTHCIVREIAFGPDQDPSVRPVALWFNISGDKVTECSVHTKKFFRWNKKQKSQQNVGNPECRKLFSSSSTFDGLDSFIMIRPMESDAFSLVRSILEHRYATVRAKRITSMRERSATLEKLVEERAALSERFSNLKRHWVAWTYPRASGRPPIDERAPVPPADIEYEPDTKHSGCCNETKEMWESFLSTLQPSRNDNADDMYGQGTAKTNVGTSYLLGDFSPVTRDGNRPRRKRLSVFRRLSQGELVNENDRSLPHIKNKRCASSSDKSKEWQPCSKPKFSYSSQSERCWKSLILQNDGPEEAEWDVVADHFTSSPRSQKVLSIVQQ